MADKACDRDLRDHLAAEISKSSYKQVPLEWTSIKTKNEEYAVFDFGCKPVFAKGSTTGYLLPYYFYLKDDSEAEGGSMELQIVSDLRPNDYKGNPYDFRYSYPLNKAVDFEALPPSSPMKPFSLAYSSIKSDSVANGIAIGAVMRTCKDLFTHKKITMQEAESEIQESRQWLLKANSDAPLGPLSGYGGEQSLKVLDARWEKCKAENANQD